MDDLSNNLAGQAPPPELLKAYEQDQLQQTYGSSGQAAIAGAEGLAQGVAGPLATALETKALGIKPADIRGREEANPELHTAGQVAGFGLSALASEGLAPAIGGAGKFVAAGIENQVAKSAVQVATESALFAAQDEVSKLLKEDPHQSVNSAVLNVGLSGLLGGGLGAGAGGFASLLNQSKMAQIPQDFKNRIAESMFGTSDYNEPIKNLIRPGAPLFEETVNAASPGSRMADMLLKNGFSKMAGKAIGASAGAIGLPGSRALGALLGERVLSPFIESALPYLAEPLMKMAADGAGFEAAAKFGASVASGESLLAKSAGALFKAGSDVLPSKLVPTVKELADLDETAKSLKDTPEGFLGASGAVNHYMPDHGMAMTEAAARAVSYIDSVRPNTAPQGILNDPRPLSKAEQASFNRTLAVAQQPLVVFDHIKKGTLLPSDLQTVQAVYPGLLDNMRQKTFNQLNDHLSKGKEVPYKLRIGLSMLLNQPLDASMSPLSISLNQAATLPRGEAQQLNQGPSRGSKKALDKLATNSQTPQQARVANKLEPA